MRRNLERLALGASLALVAIFVISFFGGLWNGMAPEPETTAVAAPDKAVEIEAPPEAAPRVEVLNAAQRPGIARAAMGRLRDADFDVVFYGNASPTMDSSLVLSRGEDDRAARAVARVLGITRVESRPDASLLLDVTVLLGRDWPRGTSTDTVPAR